MLLYLIIPFDDYVRALPNLLLAGLVLTFPFVVDKKDFKKIKGVSFFLYLIFVCYLLGNSFFSDRLESDFVVINKFFLPLILVILYIPIRDFKKISKAIVFSSLAAIVFSVINIVFLITSKNIDFQQTSVIIEGLLIDRLYLGILGILSVLVSFNSLQKKYHPYNRYHLLNILINTLFLICIMSKIGLLVLLMLVIVHQFYSEKTAFRKIITILLAFTVAVSVFAIYSGLSNTKSDISETNTENTWFQNTLTFGVRTTVWRCAVNIITEKPSNYFGIGFAETKENLIDCYKIIKDPIRRDQFLDRRYNAHNQYIDLILGAGFIGFFLFAFFLLFTFIKNTNRYFPTAVCIMLIMYCLFENIFHRQMGAYYAGFILIILLLAPNITTPVLNSKE